MDKQNLTILLVEDDHDDQFFFKEALKSLDQSIPLTITSGALEALDHMNIAIPSIIFLDINMPGLSGKDCLKKIRSNPDYDHVVIIMFTTSSSEEDIEDCFESGAHLYVIKPLSQVENVNILKRILYLHLEDQITQPTRQTFVFNAFVGKGLG
jgi:CheY-like chemotaxis protein